MSIIETRDLAKRYGKARGVRNVGLRIEEGEIFGFLGPNGEGKTTTIRRLLDLISPTSGQVLLFGRPVKRQSVELRNEVGYLPGELRLYEGMTGQQMLDPVGQGQAICFSQLVQLLSARTDHQRHAGLVAQHHGAAGGKRSDLWVGLAYL